MAVGVPDVQIKFQLGARKLQLDYRKVPLMGWSELKQAVSFTPQTLLAAIGNFDMEAVVALVWLERKQRERKLRYHDVYSELQSQETDEDFEILDLRKGGKSLIGEPDDDQGEDEDPTGGSS